MLRAVDKWMAGYLRSVQMRPRGMTGLRHLVFCLVDHFEPFRDGVPVDTARDLVNRWQRGYMTSVDGIVDADGVGPQHSFFYPEEEYDASCLAMLGELSAAGHGEVEIHLHHRNDSAEGLAAALSRFRDRLRGDHGMLGQDRVDQLRFGFIHGNWALCNSRPDGDWCGVNEELAVLGNTGCYADFTFPSAPSPTQPRVVNSIYYARDASGAPRGHDRGRSVQVDGAAAGDGELMIVEGPLALDWRRRKFGILPRLENAEVSAANPPTAARADLWARQAIHVVGKPEWVFVKLHTHGCVPANMSILLSAQMRAFHETLVSRFNDGHEWQLHYVTAREMYNVIRAAEAGKTGDPGLYRDFDVLPPPCRG